MAKEYDQERITPENAEAQIDAFLKGEQIGSVDFIAFTDALAWETANNNLRECQRLVELADSGRGIPEIYRDQYPNRVRVDSALRQAETGHILADFELQRNSAQIPGYVRAMTYSAELIREYEKVISQTHKFDMGDPELNQLRGEAEALDFVRETISMLDTEEPKPESHWLFGLLRQMNKGKGGPKPGQE